MPEKKKKPLRDKFDTNDSSKIDNRLGHAWRIVQITALLRVKCHRLIKRKILPN